MANIWIGDPSDVAEDIELEDKEDPAGINGSDTRASHVYAVRALKRAGVLDVLDDFKKYLERKKHFEDKVEALWAGITRHPVDYYLHMLEGLRVSASTWRHGKGTKLVGTWSELRTAELVIIPRALADLADDFARANEELLHNKHYVAPAKDSPMGETQDTYKAAHLAYEASQAVHSLIHSTLPKLPFENFVLISWPPADFMDHGVGYPQGVSPNMREAVHLGKSGTVTEIEIETYLDKEGEPTGLFAGLRDMYGMHTGTYDFDFKSTDKPYRWGHITEAIWFHVVIEWINDHRRYIVDKKPKGYTKKMAKRGIKAPPPPYYTVLMRDDFLPESFKRTADRVIQKELDWQHRWGVRGHEMIRVRRGDLPIAPDERTKLESRGYKIYKGGVPEEAKEDFKRLLERNVPPVESHEWLAILTTWRKPHVKGPEDKPYIPGMRKSARKREHSIHLNIGKKDA